MTANTRLTVGEIISQTSQEIRVAYQFSGRSYAIWDAIQLAKHYHTLVVILGYGREIIVSAASSLRLTYNESIYLHVKQGGE